MARSGGILLCGVTALLLSISWSAAWAITADDCFQCHSEPFARDKSKGLKADLGVDQERFKQSVHGKNDIGCVDCHADITELKMDDAVPHSVDLGPAQCPSCHSDQQEALANSVHAKPKKRGPVMCWECHEYHYVTKLESASVKERTGAFCKKCHDPLKLHPWLPQPETHFSVIECPVCHVPTNESFVNLRFWDPDHDKSLNGDEFVAAMGTDYDGFMSVVDKSGDNVISASEFWSMMRRLDDKDVEGKFHVEMLADLQPGIHAVQKTTAIRKCEECHSSNSRFFENVTLFLHSADGTPHRYVVERDALESFSLSGFYALAGTRITYVDILGILILMGGIGVVGLHLTIRILTIPERQAKKEH